jgi:hypothetical protein
MPSFRRAATRHFVAFRPLLAIVLQTYGQHCAGLIEGQPFAPASNGDHRQRRVDRREARRNGLAIEFPDARLNLPDVGIRPETVPILGMPQVRALNQTRSRLTLFGDGRIL